jgi:hypothetical protein
MFFLLVTLSYTAVAIPTPTTVAGEFNGTFPLNLEITARAYVTGTNYSEFLSESSAKVDTTQQLYALVLTTDKFPNIDIVVEATGDDTLYTYSAFGYIDDILPSNHQRINLTISRRLKPLPPPPAPRDDGGSSGGSGGGGGGSGDPYRSSIPDISNSTNSSIDIEKYYNDSQDKFIEDYEKENPPQQPEQETQALPIGSIVAVITLIALIVALIVFNIQRKHKIYIILLLAVLLLPFAAQETFAAPLPQLVRGNVSGPNKYGADVNVTFYDSGTGLMVDDGQGRLGTTTGVVQPGNPPFYAVSVTLESTTVGTYFIHVDINNSYPQTFDVIGHNESPAAVIHAQVSPRYYNIIMRYPLNITTPLNQSFLNYTYFDINWTYPNNDYIIFDVDIDNNQDFLSPEQSWTINDTNMTMLPSEALADDLYYLRVRSYDVEASQYIDEQIVSFTVDTVDPVITNINPLNESWHNASLTFDVSTNEDSTCRLDTTSGTAYDSKPTTLSGIGNQFHQYTTTFVAEGNYTYFIQCRDLAGNTIDLFLEEIYRLRYEHTHPVTTNNYTNNNTWTTADASIELTTTDASPSSGVDWVRYCIGSGCNPNTGTDYTVPVNFGEGNYTMRYRSKDIAGNYQPLQEIFIKIDQTAPQTPHNYSYNDTWRPETANIAFSPFDPMPGSDVEWTRYCIGPSCDPSTGIDYAGTIVLAEGNYTLRWQSKDFVDNYESINELQIKIDQSYPLTGHNYSFNDTWINSSQSIALLPLDPMPGSDLLWTRYCIGAACNPYTGINYVNPVDFNEVLTYLRYASRDNVNNTEPIRELVVRIDLTDPNTIDNFANHDVWINSDPTITLTPRDTAGSANSGLQWTRYCTDTDNTCIPSIDYVAPITISDENITYLRYRSKDIAGNVQSIVTKIIKLDKSGPLCAAAEVDIEGDAKYTDSTTINFNYSGFEDPLSGIWRYHYNYLDSGNYVNPDLDLIGQLSGASQGNISIFVWAEDIVNNLGCAVESSIIVDTIAPVFNVYEKELIDENSAGPLDVNVTITDATTQVDGVPTLRYRYGVGAWSGYYNMTDIGGNKYTYPIPEHPLGWNLFRGQTVFWEINVTDIVGNHRQGNLQSELVESINDEPYYLPIQNYSVNALSLLQFWVDIVEPDNDGVENQIMTFSTNVSNISITKFNNSRALVEWQPDNEWAPGNLDTNHTIIFTVTDDGNPAPVLSGNYSVRIQVNFTNEPPVLIPIGDLSVPENGTFFYDVNGSDPNGHTVTFYDNSTLWDINATTGVINYTPQWFEVGNYSVNITIGDYQYNVSEIINFVVLNVENNITFWIRDRILLRNMTGVNLTGGSSCPSPGCPFSGFKKIVEPNGIFNFTITKPGFSQINITNVTIENETEYILFINDTQAPHVDDEYIPLDYYLIFFDKYYKINTSVVIKDNFIMDNATMNYDLWNPTQTAVLESNITPMVYRSGNESEHFYNFTTHQYNTSFIFWGNVTAYDIYGNLGVLPVQPTQFIFIYRTIGINFPPVLNPIGNLYGFANEPFYYKATGFDLDESPLNFSDNATFFDINLTTGEISFIPQNIDNGTHPVNITITDGEANDTETLFFTIDVGNNVMFNVLDDTYGNPINDVLLVGGRNCIFGCVFNDSISLIEASNPSTYTFSAPGFNTSTLTFSSFDGQIVNVSLHDTQPPQTDAINLSARLSGDGELFYIDIYATISDNIEVDQVQFQYLIVDSAKGSYTGQGGTIPLPEFSPGLYATSIGPFRETIYLQSSQLTQDVDGNAGVDDNALRQFFFNSQNVTSPYLVLRKNVEYLGQDLYNITYRVNTTIFNTAGDDMVDVRVLDQDINTSFQYFNIPKESSVSMQTDIVYSKAAISGPVTLARAAASIWTQDFYSNQPSLVIPGFGGPFDLILYPEATIVPSYGDISFDVYLENMNPDFGQDTFLTYTIEHPNGTVYDLRTESLFVQADSTLRVNRNVFPVEALVPTDYLLKANITYTLGQAAYAVRTIRVIPGTCSDGVQNQNETRIDCGGPCDACPTCDDGIKNQDEVGIDCGGSICPLCENGFECNENSDCVSNRCVSGFCFPATCSDGIRNQGESDIDCGGPCNGCEAGFYCTTDDDCISGDCTPGGVCTGYSPRCFNNVQDPGETGVDCGGPCPSCGAGSFCRVPRDCESNNCALNICLEATCDDGIRNQGEAHVDCGGPCTSCLFKADRDDDLLPYDGTYQSSGFGTTVVTTSGDASALSLSTYFEKNTIQYEEEILVENIVRNGGYGIQDVVVEKVVPGEFEVRPVNHTRIYINNNNDTVIVWDGLIRGGDAYYYNYYITYKEKYRLNFEPDQSVIQQSNGSLRAQNFVRVYRKTKLLEKLLVTKQLVYKDNTDNVSVVLTFTNEGEIPLRSLYAFEAMSDESRLQTLELYRKISGEFALPELLPYDSYTITYEATTEDNVTLLPEVYGMSQEFIETKLIVDSTFVTRLYIINFIKFSSFLLLIFLTLNILYLYHLHTLKNKQKMPLAEAYKKAFYDTIVTVIDASERLYEDAKKLYKTIFDRIKNLRK